MILQIRENLDSDLQSKDNANSINLYNKCKPRVLESTVFKDFKCASSRSANPGMMIVKIDHNNFISILQRSYFYSNDCKNKKCYGCLRAQ